jgi:hypothetical protein
MGENDELDHDGLVVRFENKAAEDYMTSVVDGFIKAEPGYIKHTCGNGVLVAIKPSTLCPICKELVND